MPKRPKRRAIEFIDLSVHETAELILERVRVDHLEGIGKVPMFDTRPPKNAS